MLFVAPFFLPKISVTHTIPHSQSLKQGFWASWILDARAPEECPQDALARSPVSGAVLLDNAPVLNGLAGAEKTHHLIGIIIGPRHRRRRLDHGKE